MNDSLIKQLELAIQVEKGEVPRSEVQAKYLSDTKWVDLEDSDAPHRWDYCCYEYRRKPKPLECEVVFRGNRILGLRGSVREDDHSRIIKMREVTE